MEFGTWIRAELDANWISQEATLSPRSVDGKQAVLPFLPLSDAFFKSAELHKKHDMAALALV